MQKLFHQLVLGRVGFEDEFDAIYITRCELTMDYFNIEMASGFGVKINFALLVEILKEYIDPKMLSCCNWYFNGYVKYSEIKTNFLTVKLM